MLNGAFTQNDYRRMVTDIERQSRHMTILKPGRRLGATWIDDFVARRRAVSLCPDCERKYGDWHVRFHYHARDAKEITDCDGCGQILQRCTAYYASIM